MIKIIERGTKLINQKECKTCGCIFSYEPEDIENDVYFDLLGIFEQTRKLTYKYFINCPQCGIKIEVDKDTGEK